MNPSELKSFLDEKVALYNNPNFIESDPVQIPHLFSLKEDIEIAGLEKFADSSITVRSRMMVVAKYQNPIRREFQARVKVAFERENIVIPFPHLVLENNTKDHT